VGSVRLLNCFPHYHYHHELFVHPADVVAEPAPDVAAESAPVVAVAVVVAEPVVVAVAVAVAVDQECLLGVGVGVGVVVVAAAAAQDHLIELHHVGVDFDRQLHYQFSP